MPECRECNSLNQFEGVEKCEECGHFYLPYAEDCNCALAHDELEED